MLPDSPLAWAALLRDPGAAAHLWAVGLLLALRLMPMAWLAPWLSARAASPVAAAVPVAAAAPGLSLLLSGVLVGCFLPQALLLAPATLTLGSGLWVAAATELMRGTLLALTLALPLHAFRWAGELSDVLRDAEPAGAQAGVPMRSPLGSLYGFAALAIFFACSGHVVVLSVLSDTLRDQPLGSLPQALGPALLSAVQLVITAFELSVAFAAPVLLALFVSALLLGLGSRVWAPLAPHLSHGPLRPVLGLAVASLCAASILPQLPVVLQVFVAHARALMHTFG